jgi:hypothetical protein
MLCPRCKNPIADATKCEWCGLIIVDIEAQKKEIYDLDAKKKLDREWFWCRLVSWSILPFVAFFTIGSAVVIFSGDTTDLAKSGGVIMLIFSLIIAFPLIYWLYKTKKKLK